MCLTQFVLDALALSDVDRQYEIATHGAVMAAIGHPDGIAPAFTAVGKRRLLLASGSSAGQRRLDLQPPFAKPQGVYEIVDLTGADGVGGRLGIPFECDTVGVADVTIGADMDDQGRDVFGDQLMLLEVVPQRLFRFRAQPPLARQNEAKS